MAADRAGFFRGIAQGICAGPVGQDVVDWMWAMFMESGAGVDRSIVDLADLDQRAILAALDVPLLSFVGGADAIAAPEIGEQAARIARHGRSIRLDGVGHAPFVEDAEAYHAGLFDFLEKLG
jgi:pimeloyl-[acyl-carrier protein] methyl ester esterase